MINFDAEFFDLSYQFLHNISFITSAYNGGWGDIMQIGCGAVWCPHPGPLPQGEGENQQQNLTWRDRFPLPVGEG
ncbi:hypothetical protein GCM10011445_15300 [Pseudocitrobacter faecalis]|nr:hypothetical protein GCM10011445_15300 [Pseudocitrobacter faecalis]